MISAFDVSKALDNYGIDHDNIFWHADHHNIAFSDKSKVFCKVTRPNFSKRLLNKELALANEYATTMLTPLIDAVIPVGDVFMSVWRWEYFTSFVPELVTDVQAVQIAESLANIHRLPYPTTKIGKMDSFNIFIFNIEKRIEYGIAHNASATHINILERLLHEIVAKESLDTIHQPVLNHGDTHVGNAVQYKENGKVSWIDFESAKLAPRELDIATLKINLQMVGGNHKAWASAEDILYSDDVDHELMRKFTTVRLISMASYILLYADEKEIFQQRIELLEPLLDGAELPSSFPRTSH